jgi:hypothetical protein
MSNAPHDHLITLGAHITPQLVSALEAVFPDRMPDQVISERDLAIRIGNLQVVRLLRQAMEAAHEAGIIASDGRII